MPEPMHESPCPGCGHPVSVTIATEASSDQIAAERTRCPSCEADLVRAVEGHVDHGWRLGGRAGRSP